VQRIDRYELVERISDEDEIVVWSALDPLDGNARVTLHVVETTEANSATIARLRREAAERARTGGEEVHLSEDPKRGLFCVAYRDADGPKVEPFVLPPGSIQAPSYGVLWLIGAGAVIAMSAAIAAAVMLSGAEATTQSAKTPAPGSSDDKTVYIDLLTSSDAPLPWSTASPTAAPSAHR